MRIGVEYSREAVAINWQLSEKPTTVPVSLEKQSTLNKTQCSFRSINVQPFAIETCECKT